MPRQRVLAFILAGGKGERLYPLTRERGKPAVPFGGKYRIIDFVLSNFVNSGIYSLYVLVQYKAQSLIDHLRNAWRFGGLPEHFAIVVPPQMRWAETWYQGTADAVFQNLNLVRDFNPDIVAIFGADHIYRMDIGQMLAFHQAREADVTVAALPVPIEEARGLGNIESAVDGRMVGFTEKPSRPAPLPGDPSMALASMGNYIFARDTLVEMLTADARRDTAHDFGRNIIPAAVSERHVYAYNYLDNQIPGMLSYEERGYWRDVGTIPAYWQANMDLLGTFPRLDLSNTRWPILTAPYRGPSVRLVSGDVTDSLITEGSRIEDATVRRSIIGAGVRIEPGAVLEECLVMDYTIVGAGSHLRQVIVDRYNVIAERTRIGFDPTDDGERYYVDASGVVVLGRGPTRHDSPAATSYSPR